MMPDPLHVNDPHVTSVASDELTQKEPDAVLLPGTSPDVPQPKVPRGVSVARRIWPPLLLLFLIAAGAMLWLQQDRILDWVVLRNYKPPAAIQKLASQATFTPYAKRLFYVNHPAIEDRDVFNRNCLDDSEQEVTVLGCYAGNRRGIFMYNVTDARLDGIVQVTAAHEMLHQAYGRLGGNERARVDDLLTKYATTITDKALLKKLSAYQKLESTEVLNEEHSIFGTEIASLPPELETYYKQYFTNRSQVAAYHQQQAAAFTERQD